MRHYARQRALKEDGNENFRIFNDLLPYVEEYKKKSKYTLTTGSWYLEVPDHRLRSIQCELGRNRI